MAIFSAALGIDGARSGWVVARAAEGMPDVRLVRDLGTIRSEIASLGALVDIPIGLPGGPHPTRRCDTAARRLLGRRRSSVFPSPARATLAEERWADANAANRASTGRGLPRQSWGLIEKIRQVDTLLQTHDGLGGRLRESHPELAFAWLNGGRPMDQPKSRPAGQTARWRLLDTVWSGVERQARAFVAEARGVGLDDVADALALLALGEAGAVALPESPDRDEAGRPMEILVHPALLPENDGVTGSATSAPGAGASGQSSSSSSTSAM